jgi:MFS family permease
MGFLADRINRKMMIVLGGLIISYAILSFEWTNSFNDLVVASVLFGIGGGVSMPALMALAVLKGNETASMGSVMGLLAMAHSLGMLIGSLFAGLMMDIFQLRHAFPAGAVIMALCVGLFIVFTFHKNGKPAKTDSTRAGPLDLDV